MFVFLSFSSLAFSFGLDSYSSVPAPALSLLLVHERKAIGKRIARRIKDKVGTLSTILRLIVLKPFSLTEFKPSSLGANLAI